MHTECQITLPANFRSNDFLRYHLRDDAGGSEAATAGGLCKGLAWHGRPALLDIALSDRRLDARMHVDGGPAPSEAELGAMLVRMTGLDQDIAGFEAAVATHPRLGPLVKAQSGLRVAVTATPFEALAWAVLGQQISVKAATAIRRRFVQAAGLHHPDGLYCHPDAAIVAAMSQETMQAAGLSRTKAQTLELISHAVIDGRLPLDAWLDAPPIQDMQDQLLALRGIGPWTASYTLLRGYGWLDGSLHGDVAVRNALGTLLGQDKSASTAQTQAWLADFTPWRALAAAHLWASRALQA